MRGGRGGRGGSGGGSRHAESQLPVESLLLDIRAGEVIGDPSLDPVHFLKCCVRSRPGDEMHMIAIAVLLP